MDSNNKQITDIDGVFELQNMLYTISLFENGKPDVLPDGIFGVKTAEAVSIFQKNAGLIPNGVVDFDTWNSIVERYREIKEITDPPKKISFFPDVIGTEIKLGDSHHSIYAVQLLFEKLSEEHPEYERAEITGVIDEITENNIRKLQNAHLIEVNGRIDKKTWNKMAEFYNLFYS